MKQFQQIAIDALVTLVPLAVAAIGAYLRQYLVAKKNATNVTILRDLALQAVHTAEELGYSLNISSPEKLEHATSALTAFAAKYNITVTPDEAQRLVLAALTEMRQTEEALFAPVYTAPEPTPVGVAPVVLPSGPQPGDIVGNQAVEGPQEAPAAATTEAPAEQPVAAPAPSGDGSGGSAAPTP